MINNRSMTKIIFILQSLVYSGIVLGNSTNDEDLPWYGHGLSSFEQRVQYNPQYLHPEIHRVEHPVNFSKDVPFLEIRGEQWEQYAGSHLFTQISPIKYLCLFGKHEIWKRWTEEQGHIVVSDNFAENAGYGSASYFFNLPPLDLLEGLNLEGTCLLYPTDLKYTAEDFWTKISSFSNLRSLNVQDNPHLALDGLEKLKNLPHLEELLLGGWKRHWPNLPPTRQLNNLEGLSELTQLKMLSLSPHAGTDLSPLGKMTALKGLVLDQWGNPDLTSLAALPNLELLTLYNHTNFQGLGQSASLRALNVVNDWDHLFEFTRFNSEIDSLYSLEYLHIYGPKNHLVDILPLLSNKNLSNLRFVQINHSHIKQFNTQVYKTLEFQQTLGETVRTVEDRNTTEEVNWSLLKLIPNITKISIHGGSINLTELSYQNDLQELDLRAFPITEAQLEQLSEVRCNKLTTLVLASSNPRGLPFDALAPNLSYLNLANSNVGGGDVKNIAKLTNLVELNLKSTKVGHTAITHLSKTKSPLKRIDLSWNELKGANYALLQALTYLEELNLSGCNIAKANLITLKELINLRLLDLRSMKNPNIGKPEIEELRTLMPHCQLLSD